MVVLVDVARLAPVRRCHGDEGEDLPDGDEADGDETHHVRVTHGEAVAMERNA